MSRTSQIFEGSLSPFPTDNCFTLSFCVLLSTGAFALGWMGYYANYTATPYFYKGNLAVIAVFFVLYFVCARIYDTFKLSISRVSELIYSAVLAAVISDAVMYLVIVLLCKRFPSVLPMVGVLALQAAGTSLWALLAHRWYFAINPPKKAIIVWDMRKGLDELIHAYGLSARYQVMGTPRIEECLRNLEKHIDGMDAVFLSGIHSHDRNIVIKYCVRHDVDAYIIPRVGDAVMSAARSLHLFHLPVMKLERYNPAPEYFFFKRFFDVLLSAMALVILSPVMLAVAAAIKLTDGGTVFYRQKRLTKDGKVFEVLKFRSMRMDAEKDGVARLSTGARDDRITPVGRFIRACRIDELPQLLNIFRGDMAIVGPRPERPEIAAQYEEELPEFALRLQAKAGLTGYAQVYGQYNTTPYDKLLMDLMYIAKPSLAEDFKICFATVKILFMPESTEGVSEGQTTAMGGEKH